MVRIELIETGQFLDFTDAKITYVKQVSDIGDITKLNASYSWSMKFPKTPANAIAMGSLGVNNSTSDFPYTKNYINIYDNGIVIVRKGLLGVKETAEDYKGYVQDGIIDFIKSVSNDNIGEVIDLSELNHVNDVSTIIASFVRNDYRYIIANYNGMPLANSSGITNLAPNALIPSINVIYLFDKIMAHYGWTYTGNLNIGNPWMTYPNATAFDGLGDEVLGLTSLNVQGNNYDITSMRFEQSVPFTNQDITPDFFEYVLGSQQTSFRCLETGNYTIKYNITGTAFVRQGGFGGGTISNFVPAIQVNDVNVSVGVPSSDLTETSFQIALFEGNIINMKVATEDINNLTFVGNANITEVNMSIYQAGVQDINFSIALVKYKVKEFFKEIMIRGALTAFPDIDNKNIHFMSLDDRLDAPAIDFSDKYIKRKKESYLYNTYAKNNLLKHKYDIEGDDYDDGNLIVNNANLESEKTLFQGNTFAPLDEFVTYNGVVNAEYEVTNFKMFEIDIKEDTATGDLIASYKPLKNRFYFMESEQRADSIRILGVLQVGFPIAKINAVSYKSIVGLKYQKISQLIERTKVHEIELALAPFHIATLDLKKRYYFTQEHAYYLLNNVRYVSGNKSIGEFILISKN